MKKTPNKKALAALGFILLPILLVAVIVDRIILVILLNVEVKTFTAHLKDLRLFIPLFYRVCTFTVLTALFWLIMR